MRFQEIATARTSGRPSSAPFGRQRRAFVLALSLVSVGSSLSCARDQPEELRLALISEQLITDTFPVTDIITGPVGGLVLISAGRAYVLARFGGGNHFDEIGADHLVRPLAAAVVDSSQTIDIIDQGLSSLISLGPDTVYSMHMIRSRIVGAVHHEGRWFLALAGPNDAISVAALSELGYENIGELRAWIPPDGRIRMAVNRDDTLVLVYEEDGNYQWANIELNQSKTRIRTRVQRLPTSDPGDSTIEPLWVSTALLSINDVFLHTFADLRSDKRLLQLVTANGKLIRQRLLDLPMGLAAATTVDRAIFGIRHLEGQTLVTYRYSWERGAD